MQLCNALVPALDDIMCSKSEVERPSTVTRAVKFCPVRERTGVMHGYDLAGLSQRTRSVLGDQIDQSGFSLDGPGRRGCQVHYRRLFRSGVFCCGSSLRVRTDRADDERKGQEQQDPMHTVI